MYPRAGNSVARPLKWLGVALALMIFLVLAFSCIQISEAPEKLVAWHADLNSSRLLRAVVYSLQSVFNPLGVFSKPLLLARNWFWSMLLTAISLIGTTAVAPLVISLRRRFRLE